MRKVFSYDEGPVYLDETKMTEQICLRMRVNGQEGWHPIVSWGTHWYEADGHEVILEDTPDIEIHGNPGRRRAAGGNCFFEGLPERRDYFSGSRLMSCSWMRERAAWTFKDVGSVNFPGYGFLCGKDIKIRGIHGQFNSMS